MVAVVSGEGLGLFGKQFTEGMGEASATDKELKVFMSMLRQVTWRYKGKMNWLLGRGNRAR